MRLCIVEAQQELTLVDFIAFTHQDLADNASFEMMNSLPVALHLDLAGRYSCAGKRRQTPPDPDAADEEAKHDKPKENWTAVRRACGGCKRIGGNEGKWRHRC